MRKNVFILCCLGMVILLNHSAFSQKITIEKSYPEAFLRAYDNYVNKNYAASFEQFSALVEQTPQDREELLQDIMFYRASSAYEMMNKDADALLCEFISLCPQSAHCNEAYFLLANFYSRGERYDQAIEVYSKMNVAILNQDDKFEYYYKRGHCLFMLNRYDEALEEFDKVKDAKSKFAAPSTYFYAHILYEQGRYNLALKEFLTLQEDKSFGKIVPYYIAHIYYYQENYEELIKIAPSLSEKSQSKRSGELNRMLGDAYYKLGQYKEATPYLIKAAEQEGADVQDYYLLGFSLMEEKDFKQAKT